MAPNVHPIPPQAPPVFNATASSIVEDAKRLIATSKELQDDLSANVQASAATFSNVLLPLANAENARAQEANILRFYQGVSPDAGLRDASRQAAQLLDDFATETAMCEDLYVLVNAVLKKEEDLDLESHRLLQKVHKDFIRNGLHLPAGAQRDRFKEIKKRLSELCIAFQKNQNEENGGIWFGREDLAGVPEPVLSRLKKGEPENYGDFLVTFKMSDIGPVLRFARNGNTRRRCYVGNDNKCKENIAIFKEVMILRNEAARILGYPNHAAFRLEDKMAKTPERVNSFLSDLREKLAVGAEREIGELKQIKKEDLESREESFDGRYFLWDHPFYNGVMLKRNYSVDAQKIAEYFPLQTTITRMLGIFEHLFGLVFREVVGEERDELSPTGRGSDIVWHDDVQIFSVWDEEAQSSGFLGYLYFDLYDRDDKYGNPSDWNLQPGFTKEDGSRHYPATALLCSFPKGTPQMPILLKHDEVWNLLHELGHGIHDLVAKTTYSRFHGTASPVDFAEAPSQMLEFWCWSPSQLKALSCHYSTLSPEYFQTWSEEAQVEGKETSAPAVQLPDEMIASLMRSRYANGALFHLRQLHLGIVDMAVHSPETPAEIESLNISAYWNALRKEMLKMDGPEVLESDQDHEWGHGQANFGHMVTDYDAGYYSYLFSKVYATDMFYTAFKNDPMNAAEGKRYRRMVLEKGAAQDEIKTLIDFLGREPDTKAFYEELGLA